MDSTKSNEENRIGHCSRNQPGNGSSHFKKTKLKPHLKKQWCIPARQSGEFVARMEDILDTYALPYDPNIPLICMDEQPVQLLGELYKAIEMKSDYVKKEDFQYVRNGTCSIFMLTEPLAGWRHVSAEEHRTKVDWAAQIQELLEVHYPNASKIRLVMDNLNTHSIASLYEAYTAETAHALAQRLEVHYTPKHGSWLNIAEIELSALTLQCLNRRIGDLETLRKEIAAWEVARNNAQKTVDWQFSTTDARGKLKSLYPKI